MSLDAPPIVELHCGDIPSQSAYPAFNHKGLAATTLPTGHATILLGDTPFLPAAPPCSAWSSGNAIPDVPPAAKNCTLGAPTAGSVALLPAIQDAVDLMEADLEKPAEVIVGLLHEGSKLAMGGPSKSHKTWSLADMGVSVATGSEWQGFPTNPGRVLYVNFEIPAPFFADRIRQICTAKGVILQYGRLDIWHLRGHAGDWDTMAIQLISRIQERGYKLVIIDPTYKLMGGATKIPAATSPICSTASSCWPSIPGPPLHSRPTSPRAMPVRRRVLTALAARGSSLGTPIPS